MKRILSAWRKQPVLVTAFVVALALTLFFASRMVIFTIYWSDPAHRDQVLQGWMTPGYIAKSWDIPPEVMLEALADLAPAGSRKTLDQIATDRGISLVELTIQIEAAIAAHRVKP